jgi:hypothetical protein
MRISPSHCIENPFAVTTPVADHRKNPPGEMQLAAAWNPKALRGSQRIKKERQAQGRSR